MSGILLFPTQRLIHSSRLDSPPPLRQNGSRCSLRQSKTEVEVPSQVANAEAGRIDHRKIEKVENRMNVVVQLASIPPPSAKDAAEGQTGRSLYEPNISARSAVTTKKHASRR
jgi:hypothetical protein